MLTIKNLPLYWRFSEKQSSHPTIPSTIDFTFDVNETLGMIIEKKSDRLLSILNQVYRADANIGYMIDGHNLSQSYGADYIKFLKKVLGEFKGKKIIDVGCGGCTLLEYIKNYGAEVLGVDPSPVALRASEQKNIPLINEFLTPGLLDGHVPDAILQMDVFEHIYDPVTMLKAESEALSDQGYVIINVPNCEYSVSRGDISMAIPQHVNMFTRYSICKLVEEAGMYVSHLELSGYGSALYCAATKLKEKSSISSTDFLFELEWIDQFCARAESRILKFENFFDSLKDPSSLGYFIFQRSLPYTCAIGASLEGSRFFDNNVLWNGKYLDGVPSPVEDIKDFSLRSPQETLIMSSTFGEEIKKQILKIDDSLDVYLQEDIFD